MKRILLVALLSLVFSATTFAMTMKASNEANVIKIKKPDVELNIMSDNSTEVKMDLINQSQQPVELVAATSSIAQKVQLHHFVMVNGKRVMRQIKSIMIKPHVAEDLSFNGIHVMLIGLKQQINIGESIPLTLIFSDGSHQSIDAKVIARKQQS